MEEFLVPVFLFALLVACAVGLGLTAIAAFGCGLGVVGVYASLACGVLTWGAAVVWRAE